MGRSLTFADIAWADYLYWQTQDRKTLRRVNLPLCEFAFEGFDTFFVTHVAFS